jgi:hypothetical protein
MDQNFRCRVLARYHNQSLSWAAWIQSTPSNPISLKSILILSSHLCPGRQTGFLFFRLSMQNFVRISHLTHTHCSLLDLIAVIFGEWSRLWRCSLHVFLQASVTSSILVPHALQSTATWSTLAVCGLPTTWKTMLTQNKKYNYSFLYFNIHILDSRWYYHQSSSWR